ncbi:MAG TPA: hypothetical protein VMJ70_15135, partial [Candidatus Sulfotelmatobacter sp.]|nr:hypothetical protein [Candidatus Sulfotelmatobacter sp.]
DAAAALRLIPPGTGVWHDETETIARPTGVFDTLRVAADSFGTFDRGTWWNHRLAELVEVSATLALPDSFTDSARVWPRVGGTMALRGDFHLDHYAPWAEVATRLGRTVTLRGYLYHVPDPPDSLDGWLPLPPDEARIGFTVLGPGRAPATLGLAPSTGSEPRLHASPNPARARAMLIGRPGARFRILDLAGRTVLDGAIGPRGAFAWNLRDRVGRRIPAGLYFLRPLDTPESRASRLVVLE